MNAPLSITRQVARATARSLGRLLRRSGVEAGGGGRRWTGAPMLGNPTASALAARAPAKARAAGLHVNAALGARAIEAWTSALIGKGYQVRSQHPDEGVRRWLGDDFEGLIYPILPAFARALVRDGEALVRLSVNGDGQLRLTLLPADQLDASLNADLPGGGRITAGVELDSEDQVVAYHIHADAAGYAPPHRLPARDVLHVYDQIFPGQVRGLSWLAPVLLKLHDRDESSDALLMALKVQSLVTGYIRDPEGGTAGFGEPDGGSAVSLALEPGAMRILPPGADVTFSQPGQGLTQAVEFLRAQDREIAAGCGLTYEMLTGDLGQTSYSSARVGLLEFRRRAEMLQKLLIEGQFLRPLWRRWIETLALAGTIPADQLADHLPVRFIAPGWQWIDPKSEVLAEVAAINAGLKSREEVIAARGRDVDDLDRERARDAAAPQAGAAS